MARNITIIILVFASLISLYSSVYVVDERQHALVLEFGKVVDTRLEAGLYFKVPFIQNVVYIDNRLRRWDGEPSDLLTEDKKNIEINTWARWRVTDPQNFYEAVRTEVAGQGLLDGLVDSNVKNVIASNTLMEVLRNTNRKFSYESEELEAAELAKRINIGTGRVKVTEAIFVGAGAGAKEKYGFEIVGLEIKHINYVRQVIPSIFARMKAERNKIAEQFKSEGKRESEGIIGDMKKQLQEIESEGYKQATEIRGLADAEAVRIYAEAYSQDAEFYSFQKALKSYGTTLGSKTRLVIDTDSDLFQYLQSYKILK
jgi:membrane protease subunit HflC